ncbi:TetR/AcrR family transcriptional regulator [Streptomyces sp. B6B3]|uniref:TetR/AcrR family transcriptional regulator n=1 Tax=Streptomyces sp. B6B3 TaxID=3153570 RepID=UPI00325C7E8B
MPRHVDHDQRRRQVAEALWRVVAREGLERATVRAVATEAGLSLGAISHYFGSQEELQRYALRLVDERDAARLAAISHEGTAREVVERYLWALLPLDEESRQSNAIYYAFMARARVVPAFREIAATVNDEITDLCRSGIEGLAGEGGIAPGRDVETLVAEFRALTEGLSFRAAMWPDQTPPELIRAVVTGWLDALLPAQAPPPGPPPGD